jgi:hypothetical protein
MLARLGRRGGLQDDNEIFDEVPKSTHDAA